MTSGEDLRRFRHAADVSPSELAECYGSRAILALEQRPLVTPPAVRRYCAEVLAVFDSRHELAARYRRDVRPTWAVLAAYIASGGESAKLGDVLEDPRAQLRAEIYMAQLRVARLESAGQDATAAAQSLAALEDLAAKQGVDPWARDVELRA